MRNFNSFFDAFVNDVLENVLAGMESSFNNQTSTNDFSNEDLFLNKEVYLDTSSFMYDEADRFFIKIVPLLERYGKPINTLSCCIREINKHLNSDDYDKYHKALQAKERIERLLEAGLLNIIDYSNDVFADADFLAYFSKRRIYTEILFISQDGNLSIDVYKLNESRSVDGHDIVVKKINANGSLSTNHKLEEYLDEGPQITDDYFDDGRYYKTVMNNSGGINIAAANIKEVKIRRHEVITDALSGNKHNNPGNFWLSIY
jgi:hypothetical protein